MRPCSFSRFTSWIHWSNSLNRILRLIDFRWVPFWLFRSWLGWMHSFFQLMLFKRRFWAPLPDQHFSSLVSNPRDSILLYLMIDWLTLVYSSNIVRSTKVRWIFHASFFCFPQSLLIWSSQWWIISGVNLHRIRSIYDRIVDNNQWVGSSWNTFIHNGRNFQWDTAPIDGATLLGLLQ